MVPRGPVMDNYNNYTKWKKFDKMFGEQSRIENCPSFQIRERNCPNMQNIYRKYVNVLNFQLKSSVIILFN